MWTIVIDSHGCPERKEGGNGEEEREGGKERVKKMKERWNEKQLLPVWTQCQLQCRSLEEESPSTPGLQKVALPGRLVILCPVRLRRQDTDTREFLKIDLRGPSTQLGFPAGLWLKPEDWWLKTNKLEASGKHQRPWVSGDENRYSEWVKGRAPALKPPTDGMLSYQKI